MGAAVIACALLLAAAPAAAGPRPARPAPAVLILLDTHGQPSGRRIPAERAAALRYLAALPTGVRAGLITFNASWQLRLRPTARRRPLRHALTEVRPATQTSTGLFTAIAGAQSVLRRLHAPGRLLILSNAEGVLSRSQAPAIPVDVVRWHYDGDDNVLELGALAAATGGHVTGPGQAASLAAAFPRAPRRPAQVSGPGPVPRPGQRPSRVPWLLVTGLACLFVALLLAARLLLRPFAPGSSRRIIARIERYGPQHAAPGTVHQARQAPAGQRPGSTGPSAGARGGFHGDLGRYDPAEGRSAGHGPGAAGPGKSGMNGAAMPRQGPDSGGGVTHKALGLAASLLRSTNSEAGLAERLDHAGIARSPAEWVLLTGCAGAALAAVFTAAAGSALAGLPAGGLAAWITMRLVVSVRTSRRRAAFAEQLPDVLRLVAGSLQSGFSLPQAVDGVVREDSQPAAGEFSRALAEVRVGADLGDALNRVADRMDSADLRLTVMAVRIQREVGGNLAEVLNNSIGTMRERAFLRRQVRALSAEGRMSAYILLALPFGVGAWFFFVDPAYMSLLYTTLPGLIMLAGSGVLIALGVAWMRKLINIEV